MPADPLPDEAVYVTDDQYGEIAEIVMMAPRSTPERAIEIILEAAEGTLEAIVSDWLEIAFAGLDEIGL